MRLYFKRVWQSCLSFLSLTRAGADLFCIIRAFSNQVKIIRVFFLFLKSFFKKESTAAVFSILEASVIYTGFRLLSRNLVRYVM